MTAFGGIFGIHNHSAALAVDLAAIVIAVIWIALVYWTFADARRRISEPLLVGCATIVSLMPFIGTIVYMIVRPPEYLDDVRERSLEIRAAEARLVQIGVHSCPYCDYEVERDFLRCPNCLRRLREPCVSCGKPLAAEWKLCPYCEADRGLDPSLTRRSSRRSRRDPRQPAVTPPPSDLI